MQNTKYKTIMCRYVQSNKHCPLGNRCHFAHNKDQLRKKDDQLPKNAPIMNKQFTTVQQIGNTEQVVGAHNYKTVMCKYWQQDKCKFQQKCSYAHGQAEVRNSEVGDQKGQKYAAINPLKYGAFEHYLRHKQLSQMVNSLEKRYKDSDRINCIKNARILLDQWKINQAAVNLMKIIYDPYLSVEDKEYNKKVMEESCNLAQDLLKIWNKDDFQKLFKIVQDYQIKVQKNFDQIEMFKMTINKEQMENAFQNQLNSSAPQITNEQLIFKQIFQYKMLKQIQHLNLLFLITL